MLLIGLTGGIASGKTFVSECFETHGAPVLDADHLAREVVEPGSDGLRQLVTHFGKSILTSEEKLDRRALRDIIFANPQEREFLDNTLHPQIRKLSEERIEAAGKLAYPYLVYAVPLLVETTQQKRFDRIVVVDVPEALQIQRLTIRDGSSSWQAQSILDAQATRQERLAIADDVIDNSMTKEETQAQVAQLHLQYMSIHNKAL
ncbi:MAG: dephospho-CoA kinase [Granulosicoccus sp.]